MTCSGTPHLTPLGAKTQVLDVIVGSHPPLLGSRFPFCKMGMWLFSGW